jgi:hypothetical protein
MNTLTSVLDAKLFIKLDLSSDPGVTLGFQEAPEIGAHFVNQLLLFDSIVIPTYDMGVIAAITSWLGAEAFKELLDCGGLHFLRSSSMFGYVGNGVGLVPFRISLSEQRPIWNNWWEKALFDSESPEAAELQLRHLCYEL